MRLEHLSKPHVENSAPGKSVMSRQGPDLFHHICRIGQLPSGMSSKDMAFIDSLSGGERGRQDLLVTKQKIQLDEDQLGNHDFPILPKSFKKSNRDLVKRRCFNSGVSQNIRINADHSANGLGIITKEIPKHFRIMHQHLGANGRRKFPAIRWFLFERGIRSNHGLCPPPDHLGNAPFLVARDTLNLSVELVW
jgi:hypothetical protein